jgi:hypothetical protein
VRKEWRFGSLSVRLIEQKPAAALYDFYERVSEAEVTLRALDGRSSHVCPYRPRLRRHQCKAGWNNVRQKLAEVGYTLRRCVYAHPADHGVVEIRYADVPFGSRLVLHTGLDGYPARFKARRAVYRANQAENPPPNAPRELRGVKITIRAGDQEVAAVTHPIDDEWRRHDIETPELSKERRDVTFLIETRWSYSKPFCFYAQTRP